MEKIDHEVMQLVITNENIQSELESLLFGAKNDTLLNVLKRYKYFHLYVKGDSDCQTLEFRLSNYPYKSENLIGFCFERIFSFCLPRVTRFSNISRTQRKFSYIEHKLGDFVMREDDTPCWIIGYRKSQFKVLHYPSKR